MNEHPDFTPAKIGGADDAHAAVRAALSAIPLAGGAAMELFNWSPSWDLISGEAVLLTWEMPISSSL